MGHDVLAITPGHQGMVRPFHQRSAGYRPHFHTHDELEFNLITSGSASYLIRDRRFDLAPGTVIWLFPKQAHLLVNESADFGMWIAVFRESLVQSACTSQATSPLREDDPAGFHCSRINRHNARTITDLCERLAVETGLRPAGCGLEDTQIASRKLRGAAPSGGDPATVNAGLGWLLVSTWRATRAAASGTDLTEGSDIHPAVERAAFFLRDHTDRLSLKELADRSGLSPSRLSRLFKQQVGISISAYGNRQRVERFVHLYGRGRRISMLTAALDAGFGSYAQFHRAFKQFMHQSPSGYRRQVTQGRTSP